MSKPRLLILAITQRLDVLAEEVVQQPFRIVAMAASCLMSVHDGRMAWNHSSEIVTSSQKPIQWSTCCLAA